MKKSAVVILLLFTVAFSAFVAGFYIGKNYNRTSIEVSATQLTVPSESTTADTCGNSSAAAPTSAKRININTATLAELDTLVGIGPVLAQAIIDYRQEHPFEKPEDLLNVNGIGPKTLEKILDQITV